MGIIAIFRAAFGRSVLWLIIMIFLLATPALPEESVGSETFFKGFKAFNNKDYPAAIEILTLVMQKSTDQSLREISLYWLIHAHVKSDHVPEAAQSINQFLREFPNSKLRRNVEIELAKLPGDKTGISTATAAPRSVVPDKVAAAPLPPEKEKPAAVTAENMPVAKPAPPPVVQEKSREPVVTAVTARAEIPAVTEKQQVSIPEKAPAEKAVPREAPKKTVAAAVELPVPAAPPKKATRVAVAPRKAEPTVKADRKKTMAAQKAALKAAAVAEYKSVMDRYPGTPAAVKAAAHLKKLGYVSPPSPGRIMSSSGEKVQTLVLEVEQFADLAVTLAPTQKINQAGKSFTIPFQVVNNGNGPDSFTLISGSPPEFGASFAARNAPDQPIAATPQLAPNTRFEGVMTAVMPANSLDGQQYVFPVKIGSRFAADVSLSREVALTASAPLLRAVLKPDKNKVLPGGKVTYQVALMNLGSAPAAHVTIRLDHSPQYEPLDLASSGFWREATGSLVLADMKIDANENKNIPLTFLVKRDAPARQELILRVDLLNNELAGKDSFVSGSAVEVEAVSGVTVKSNLEKMVVIPGQTVTVPFVVTNTGNIREAMLLKPDLAPGVSCKFFRDRNRSGIRLVDEPEIVQVRPLAPYEEENLLMELSVPPTAADGSTAVVGIVAQPENSSPSSARLTVSLQYARPIVDLAMAVKSGKLRPGEVTSFELNIVNNGSNLARTVELSSVPSDNIEIVESDPPFRKGGSGEYAWTFSELGKGEKRNVRVAFRVKPGIPMGTSIQIRNQISYQDQLGNRY